jgi:tRNA G37 N-methylase Trm5
LGIKGEEDNMLMPKYTFKELRRNLYYILFDSGSWDLFFCLLKNMKNWTRIESSASSDYSVIKHKKLGFTFCSNLSYQRAIISEWEIWRKYYVYPFNLKGKTILDVGAGCGETALLFSNRGAKKVICIEQNEKLLPYIQKNVKDNRMNIDLHLEPFNINHLDLAFDAVKMDIEGGERELLKLERISFPIVLEAHSRDLAEAFQKRGFRIILKLRSTDKYIVILNNFQSKELDRDALQRHN